MNGSGFSWCILMNLPQIRSKLIQIIVFKSLARKMIQKVQTLATASPKKQSHIIRELLFGFAFAIASKSVYAPFSFLQIRYQTYEDLYRKKKIDYQYTGLSDTVRKVKKNQGWRGFWKGNTSAIMSKGINNFFVVAYRDMVTEEISGRSENQKHIKNFTYSFLAPLITLIPVVATYPLQYARTRIANNGIMLGKAPQFSGYRDVFKKTWTSQGLHGIYRGLTASLLRMGVHRVTYFGLYDSLRFMNKQMGFLQQLLIVNLVTCIAGVLSYPFDTARRRMMMCSLQTQRYEGLGDFFRRTVINNENPFKIYRGISIYLLKQFLGSFSILLYDRYGTPKAFSSKSVSE